MGLAQVADALRGLAADPLTAARLARAGTTATLRDGDEDTQITLLLDREPVEVVDGAVPDAEIELVMSPAAIAEFLSGRTPLSMTIASGGVSYRGPVRKLLRVEPILRRRLRYARA